MFQDWQTHTQDVKAAFKELGAERPKMLKAYGALTQAIDSSVLDDKTRELISLAVAVTTRCESCISVHAEAAVKAGASDDEVAAALATAIALNAGAAYTYSLRAIEAVKAQR
jgi:4-carboxymuconolactone decarboxylase family protein